MILADQNWIAPRVVDCGQDIYSLGQCKLELNLISRMDGVKSIFFFENCNA